MIPIFRKVIDAVTATTTSAAIDIKHAKKVIFVLTRSDHTSGSSAFTVTGSIVDGVTDIPLNILRDNATGVYTLVSGKTLSANGSAVVALDLDESGFAFDSIKITVTETTDGTHSAGVYIVR